MAPLNQQRLPARVGDGISWDNLLDARALAFGLEDGWK